MSHQTKWEWKKKDQGYLLILFAALKSVINVLKTLTVQQMESGWKIIKEVAARIACWVLEGGCNSYLPRKKVITFVPYMKYMEMS